MSRVEAFQVYEVSVCDLLFCLKFAIRPAAYHTTEARVAHP